MFFRGPDGDVDVFHTEFRAVLYAEAIDVNNGEYGDHGWDADGRPIALVTRDPNLPKRGLLARLFGLRHEDVVEFRRLGRPAEPEVLRRVLVDYFTEHPRFAEDQPPESRSLDELVGLMKALTIS